MGSKRYPLRLASVVSCIAIASLAITSVASGQTTDTIAFEDVKVIPVEQNTVLVNHTVIVRGDRIVEIGPSQDVVIPPGARVISGEGRYLLPGLVDSHVHLREPESSLLLFVANGVTTVREMKGSPERLRLRERINRGEVFGPSIYTTSPFIERHIEEPGDVERLVREQKRAGYDLIKVHGDMPEDTYRDLVQTANQEQIAVVGHIPRNLELDVVLSAGQKEISHAEEFLYTYFDSEVSDTSGVATAARAARRTDVWVVPTLIVFDYIVRQAKDDYFKLIRMPELIYVTPERRHAWITDGYREYIDADEVPWYENARALLGTLIEALHREDVRLLIGTDTPLEFVVPGFSVHDELQLLVEHGMTPYEAIRAATVNAAEFMGALDVFGTIAAGKRADLMLVDRNPLDDVEHLRNPAGVMLRGQWLPRKELDNRLAKLASEYAARDVEFQARLTTLERIVQLALEEDLETALDRLRAIKHDHPDLTVLTESGLNRVGYRLLGEGKTMDAIEVFKLNVETFPKSANVYDSLGEAYMTHGNTELAIYNYEKALELDPTMGSAEQALKTLRNKEEP